MPSKSAQNTPTYPESPNSFTEIFEALFNVLVVMNIDIAWKNSGLNFFWKEKPEVVSFKQTLPEFQKQQKLSFKSQQSGPRCCIFISFS